MNALSPTGKGRVEEVRSRIFRKLYDTKELKEGTVNKFVQSQDFRNGVSAFSMSKTPEVRGHSDSSRPAKRSPKASSNTREKKIKEAMEKRQRGYYNNPEVFSKVAQRLIDLFEP
jgi:hypothetical protein